MGNVRGGGMHASIPVKVEVIITEDYVRIENADYIWEC